jgi:pimeloyl-ACP methyl ester carboxylesterase
MPQATILYLHGGDGSLSDTLPQLQALHTLGFSVFAIDYRGYGRSASVHPNEKRMNEDAEHAFQYLTSTRKLPLAEVIPYGIGVGASLAAALVQQHPQIQALILESPQTDLMATVAQDPRTRLIPLHLLFHNNFSLADRLHMLATPKLLLSYGLAAPPVFRNAADPKITVEFMKPSASDYAQAISRFTAEYLPPAGVPQLIPARK